MATQFVKPSFIEGMLRKDTQGWREYVKVDGQYVKHWIWDRLAELPEGAVVRISAEVVDNGAPNDSA